MRPGSDPRHSVVALEDVVSELASLYTLLPLVLPAMYERRWGRVIGIGLLMDWPSPAYASNVGKAARLGALALLRDDA